MLRLIIVGSVVASLLFTVECLESNDGSKSATSVMTAHATDAVQQQAAVQHQTATLTVQSQSAAAFSSSGTATTGIRAEKVDCHPQCSWKCDSPVGCRGWLLL